MNPNLIVTNEIKISASKEDVWKTLLDPEKIKIYFFGTNASSDWKEGSSLTFQGEYQGQIYEDKGVIQKIIMHKFFQFTYISSFSGLSDEPQNYSLVSYELEEERDQTNLKITQRGFVSETSCEHSNTAWKNVLQKIKELAEL